ncbi:hypothetical protein M8C21_005339, partial [Ambrosia artemisiifolia]
MHTLYHIQAEKDPRTGITTCIVNNALFLQQPDTLNTTSSSASASMTPTPFTPDIATSNKK